MSPTAASRPGHLRPSYYVAKGGLEPLHVIADWHLGFLAGNVVKYLMRAGTKGPASVDLAKAVTYAQLLLIKLSTGAELAEWSAPGVRRLSVIHIADACGFDQARLIALGAVHDLTKGPVLADVYARELVEAIEGALARARAKEADAIERAADNAGDREAVLS
jgi:Protein of unknwon function (DUF3310)